MRDAHVWDIKGTEEKKQNDNDVSILVDALAAVEFMCVYVVLYTAHVCYIHTY